jgi:phosphoribosylglycinamide formyltransferase 1
MKKRVRIGALISGGGTNLQAIIDACESNKIDGEMVFVGADVPEARGLERSRRHGIPHFVVDYDAIIRNFRQCPRSVSIPSNFIIAEAISRQSLFQSDVPRASVEFFLATRAIAEAELLKSMAAYPYDLLVLAGFMRNLTPYFIDRVNFPGELPRIMNIHPALLPSFPGTDGYGDTFRYGCKIGGCTVHFIDYGEDSGPIIGQRAFPIDPEDTIDIIREKGLKEEWILYPECIQLFAENRLEIISQGYKGPTGALISRQVVRVLAPKPAI